MGIAENWQSFVNMTKAKADSHSKVAQSWDFIHNVLSMTIIVLSALTTLATLLPISHYVAATLGAITTLVSAIAGSMAPSSRRQMQMESSKGFRALMLRMVRVETEREYEELWKEYNKEMLNEPFMPAKYKVEHDTNFAMTPEFTLIVKQKENEVKCMIENLDESEAGDEVKSDDAQPGASAEEPERAVEEADCRVEVAADDQGRDDVKLLQQM
jgi:hypothetical protein